MARLVDIKSHQLKQLKTESWQIVLVVYAHPDDEVVMGGTIAKLASEGKRVVLVVATNGELGINEQQQYSPGKLREIRRKEQLTAAKILGVSETIFLNYPDQGLESNQKSLERKLEKSFLQNQPNAVFTWSFPPRYFFHRDHEAATRATIRSLQRIGLYLNPSKPELYLFMPPYDLATHCFFISPFCKKARERALGAHFSQITSSVLKTLSDSARENYQKIGRAAEVFAKIDY